jgi:hypothetical protein
MQNSFAIESHIEITNNIKFKKMMMRKDVIIFNVFNANVKQTNIQNALCLTNSALDKTRSVNPLLCFFS